MPNYNALILTAADYTFFLNVPGGGTYKLRTLDSIDMNISVEEELIYAVSEEDAVGNKQNARKCTGKISYQVGENFSILALEGLPDATRLVGCTIACVAIRGGFNRTLKSVNFNSESITIKRRDKETLANCDFTALSIV
jgi:hypothetical protein